MATKQTTRVQYHEGDDGSNNNSDDDDDVNGNKNKSTAKTAMVTA